MKEQILETVGKRQGLMGMEIEGLSKETVSLMSGMLLAFYEKKKRGRGFIRGNRVCVVCSTKIVDEVISGGDRHDLPNGLTVIFE